MRVGTPRFAGWTLKLLERQRRPEVSLEPAQTRAVELLEPLKRLSHGAEIPVPCPEESSSMRIAQIAPLTEAIPPRLYGGTERVISWLTEELVELGHDVTLFASGDSRTSAKLEAMWPRALRLDDTVRDPMALHIAMLEHVRRRADDFDILHFHLD